MLTFVSFHQGPAAHFYEFTTVLKEHHIPYQILATPLAGSVYKNRGEYFIEIDLDTDFAPLIEPGTVIADVGELASETLFEQLDPRAYKRIAYYDNPEAEVPGSYSKTALRVMQTADCVLFANPHLALQKELYPSVTARRVGLGYYSLAHVEQIQQLRANLHPHQGPKIALYIGSAHGTPPPVFEPLAEWSLLYQRHPRNKKPAPFTESTDSFIEAVAKADLILYSQTSAAGELACSGIPLIQVAEADHPDTLVRSGLCPTVSTPEELQAALDTLTPLTPEQILLLKQELGSDPHWRSTLLKVLK